MRVTIKLYLSLEPGAKAPLRASEDASGYDLFAHHDAVIEPGETALISTGVRLAIPEGYEAQVRPRSGLSLRTKLRVANSPGTIDADYRGLVSIICENIESLLDPVSYLLGHPDEIDHFHENYQSITLKEYMRQRTHKDCSTLDLPEKNLYLDPQGHPMGTIYITRGERIAQLVFMKVEIPELIEVDDVSVIGNDRGGGFGSTGKR